jgi:magnesium transporter
MGTLPLVQVLTRVDATRIKQLLAKDTFFWLDLAHPSEADLDRIEALLGLHPAAVEDTREWEQLPKLDDYGEHVMLVFFGAGTVDGASKPLEVHVYASGGWIVTARRCECKLDRLHEWLEATDQADEDELLYHVLDALADDWDPVIDAVDVRVDKVENEVLERPRQGQLTTIYRLKQEVSDLLRHATAQAHIFPEACEVIHRLPGLSRGSREWLRDVESHLDGLSSDLQRINGDLHALTETFFNANANRLNRLASVVAVASVFFLVWTLFTSFFGQNFGWLVKHVNSGNAFLLWGIVAPGAVMLAFALVAYWRRRDWW